MVRILWLSRKKKFYRASGTARIAETKMRTGNGHIYRKGNTRYVRFN